jgi:hypothetical protein
MQIHHSKFIEYSQIIKRRFNFIQALVRIFVVLDIAALAFRIFEISKQVSSFGRPLLCKWRIESADSVGLMYLSKFIWISFKIFQNTFCRFVPLFNRFFIPVNSLIETLFHSRTSFISFCNINISTSETKVC